VKRLEFKENFKINESKDLKKTKVKESFLNDKEDKLTVKIEAIHAITTGNYNTYPAKELRGDVTKRTGAFSWTHPYNKPVLTHHNSYNGEPVGRVIEAKYQESSQAGPPVIVLTVEITDKDAIEKVKDGRYVTVSIGGSAEHAYCSICGNDWLEEGRCEHWPGYEYDGKTATLEMADLTFVEVSFVNVPADSYAKIIDVEESQGAKTTEEFYITTNGKAVEENMQGGKEMDLKELQSKYDKLNESYKTKEERVTLLEKQVENIESERDAALEESKTLSEKNSNLEIKLTNLENELDDLTAENAELKDKQHKILAEKVVQKKIEMNKLKEEELEDAIEEHVGRKEESLKDTLKDLEKEAEMLAEESEGETEITEPGEPTDKEGLHNAEGEENVETVEEDEDLDDKFDIKEELKNL